MHWFHLIFALSASADCTFIEEGYGTKGAVPVKAVKVVTGLEVPWGLAFLPQDKILVTERVGRVRQVVKGKLLEKPLFTVNVNQDAESGLLGIAAHPSFEKNRFIYIYYTIKQRGKAVNRVERYKVSTDGNSASADKMIIDDIPSAKFHSGGRIKFGADGMLYIGTGDAREPDSAQDKDSLAGKILRLTPEGEIPADNPWPKKAQYIAGIRNMEAFDWIDAKTMVLADHGPSGELFRSGGDEVSMATAGDNLGWPDIWKCQTKEKMNSPLITWKNSVPPGGGAVYTGNAIPEWKGSFIVGALGARSLHRVSIDKNTKKTTQHEVYFAGEPPTGFGRLREVAMSPQGELYVTTSNCDGRGDCTGEKDMILRITK